MAVPGAVPFVAAVVAATQMAVAKFMPLVSSMFAPVNGGIAKDSFGVVVPTVIEPVAVSNIWRYVAVLFGL